MQATVYIPVPNLRDGLLVVNLGGYSYQNKVVILSKARSAESKDLRLSSPLRRIC
jgi:hypothetical protein